MKSIQNTARFPIDEGTASAFKAMIRRRLAEELPAFIEGLLSSNGDARFRPADQRGLDFDLPMKDQNAMHMQRLVLLMAHGISAVNPLVSYAFGEVIWICTQSGLFPWVFGVAGNLISADAVAKRFEVSAACRAGFGKKLTEASDSLWTIETGQRVLFHSQGKSRARRFIIELLAADAMEVVEGDDGKQPGSSAPHE